MSVITVAREFGSNGKVIARLIAERLGYDCVDKELIAEIARASGVSQEAVEQLDEVGESGIRRFLRELFTPSNIYPLSPDYPPLIWPYLPGVDTGGNEHGVSPVSFLDRTEYTRILLDTIQTLAKRDNLVVVGRGSQCLLADRPDTLHLRFVAPLEYRVKTIQEELNLDSNRARELVHDKDRERALYLQQTYHRSWQDAPLYHAILNSATCSLERMADIVVIIHDRMLSNPS